MRPMQHVSRTVLAAVLSVVLSSEHAARADDVTVAQHTNGFTAAQRQEIIGIVRQALKTDPSILSDAILSLRAEAEKNQASDSAAAVQRNRAALAGTPGDYIAGNPNGDVTLVAFYDPRCPYCRKALPDLDALVASDHKLRLVEKLIPILGPNSLLQSKAIVAAGRQSRYSAFQHALMNDAGPPGMDQIDALAGRQGLDLARLNRDMADPALEARLRSDVALAQALGITGTPSFVIGGKVIAGAVGLDGLRQAISDARSG